MNPMEVIKNFMGRGMNPQQILSNMMSNNKNPILNNLMKEANSGNTKGVETFARNLFKQQGRDFDKEFNEFKQFFK